MRSTIMQLVILISFIDVLVYGTRTTNNGHALSSEISMVAGDLEGADEGEDLH
jgi:hypothetical protein